MKTVQFYRDENVTEATTFEIIYAVKDISQTHAGRTMKTYKTLKGANTYLNKIEKAANRKTFEIMKEVYINEEY